MFASTSFTVNQRRLVNPPAMLWRVEHSGNQDSVFSSRASPAFTGWSDFNDVKRAHADWHSRRATPFLSTTWYVVHAQRLEEPPATLWRVEHSGNQDSVFSSRASPEFGTDGDFAAAKRQHLNWYNKQPTPFLSTFSHHGHALNWARQRVTQMHDPCVQVHEIDTNGLLVFGAGGDEFLVLDEIPLGNVMDTLSMRRSANGRRRQQQRMGRGRRTGGYDPYYVPQSKPTDEDYSDTTSSGESYYY